MSVRLTRELLVGAAGLRLMGASARNPKRQTSATVSAPGLQRLDPPSTGCIRSASLSYRLGFESFFFFYLSLFPFFMFALE